MSDLNSKEKSLHNTDPESAKKNVSDIKVHGDPDLWKCISKASSEKEGWMKSTKVMAIPGLGSMVQVSTQQRTGDNSYVVAEALAFVPNAILLEVRPNDGGEDKYVLGGPEYALEITMKLASTKYVEEFSKKPPWILKK